MLDVGAENLPELLVPALANEVQIYFAYCRQVAVRLIHSHWILARVRDREPVVGNMALLQWFQDGNPHAVGLVFHGNFTGLGDDGNCFGQVLDCPDGDVSVIVQVRAEDGMGRVMFTVCDLSQGAFVHVQRHPRVVSSC